MAQEKKDETGGVERQPLSSGKKKRLQQVFEHATRKMVQVSHDYVNELLTQCVMGDPSSIEFVQAYLMNLRQKYKNNKTGSSMAMLKGRGARSAVKKGISSKKWMNTIENGLAVLAINPWDIPTLLAMATASEGMGDDESEMAYLKAALESNSKDPVVNKQCAKALAARHQYDQAIACWHRVEQALKDDNEAQRAIASLSVEKTIVKGKLDEERKTKATAQVQDGKSQEEEEEIDEKELAKEKIAQNPGDPAGYLELGQAYINDEDYATAVKNFEKAYGLSNEDIDIRERLEDVQLRYMRQQIMAADAKGDVETRDKLRKDLNDMELDVYKSRCERYPANLGFKYDLGLRYQVSGDYNSAIKEFQNAKNDPRRRGVCLLALAQCFQKIKQYRLAASHFNEAIEEIPERDARNLKMALYQAGKLFMALKEYGPAEKHLAKLAGMDFSYKDVSELLDKITKLRENE